MVSFCVVSLEPLSVMLLSASVSIRRLRPAATKTVSACSFSRTLLREQRVNLDLGERKSATLRIRNLKEN
jgi:hypothetical protein